MAKMTAITLTTEDSIKWDDDGPDGYDERAKWIAKAKQISARDGGSTVEIYHVDGYVLYAVC